MDYFREMKKEDRRFRTIVNNIGTYCDSVVDKEQLDFLVRSAPLAHSGFLTNVPRAVFY